MSKKPNSGLDYTPRRAKAIEAAKQRPMERHAHGVVQRQARYPIYEVTACGKTVDWTDMRIDAHNAFTKAQTLPKRLVLVHADGRRVLLDEVSKFGRHQLAIAA